MILLERSQKPGLCQKPGFWVVTGDVKRSWKMRKVCWISLVLVSALVVMVLAIPRPGGIRSLRAGVLEHVYLPIIRRQATVSRPPLCPGEQEPLITDRQVYQTPETAEPPARVPFRDPVFRTCVVRVTDRQADISAGDSSQGLKDEYSRVQSFNANGSYILVRGIEATWYLYDATTLEPTAQMPFDGSVDPRWDASDPNVLYYCDEASGPS